MRLIADVTRPVPLCVDVAIRFIEEVIWDALCDIVELTLVIPLVTSAAILTIELESELAYVATATNDVVAALGRIVIC